MADRIAPTPRNKLSGFFADLLGGFDSYAQRPDPVLPLGKANPPLSLLSDFADVPALARTLDRMSYDEPLTTGSGMTTAIRPDARDAVLAVLPMAAKSPRAALGALAAVDGGMTSAGLAALAPAKFVGRPLNGLPKLVDIGGGVLEPFGTDQRIVDVASRYMADKGMKYRPQLDYVAVDPKRATKLADAFELMQHAPEAPAVQKSYKALARETQDQFEALLKAGYKFDFIRGTDPYGRNPRNAINDLMQNQRLMVFPTSDGFGGPAAMAADISGNPLLARSELRIAGDPNTTYNDLFRAVHDVFGHAKHGVGFRARGEENAFQAHARMYSPEALPAATSETRGQNSWVNFGPYAKKNLNASPLETEYAPQKTGLLGPWAWEID